MPPYLLPWSTPFDLGIRVADIRRKEERALVDLVWGYGLPRLKSVTFDVITLVAAVGAVPASEGSGPRLEQR